MAAPASNSSGSASLSPHDRKRTTQSAGEPQIDYFYASRLPGEPAAGVPDRHFHPVEPLAVRVTVAATL